MRFKLPPDTPEKPPPLKQKSKANKDVFEQTNRKIDNLSRKDAVGNQSGAAAAAAELNRTTTVNTKRSSSQGVPLRSVHDRNQRPPRPQQVLSLGSMPSAPRKQPVISPQLQLNAIETKWKNPHPMTGSKRRKLSEDAKAPNTSKTRKRSQDTDGGAAEATTKRRKLSEDAKAPSTSKTRKRNQDTDGATDATTAGVVVLPDSVPSDSISAAADPFEETEYAQLRTLYLEERNWVKVLTDGIRLRGQKKKSRMDCEKGPGWDALRQRFAKLEAKNDHHEIFRLLSQLKRWEQLKGPFPSIPGGGSEVQEIVDLSNDPDDGEVICVDSDDDDVPLAKAVKADPDSLPDESTGVQQPMPVTTSGAAKQPVFPARREAVGQKENPTLHIGSLQSTPGMNQTNSQGRLKTIKDTQSRSILVDSTNRSRARSGNTDAAAASTSTASRPLSGVQRNARVKMNNPHCPLDPDPSAPEECDAIDSAIAKSRRDKSGSFDKENNAANEAITGAAKDVNENFEMDDLQGMPFIGNRKQFQAAANTLPSPSPSTVRRQKDASEKAELKRAEGRECKRKHREPGCKTMDERVAFTLREQQGQGNGNITSSPAVGFGRPPSSPHLSGPPSTPNRLPTLARAASTASRPASLAQRNARVKLKIPHYPLDPLPSVPEECDVINSANAKSRRDQSGSFENENNAANEAITGAAKDANGTLETDDLKEKPFVRNRKQFQAAAKARPSPSPSTEEERKKKEWREEKALERKYGTKRELLAYYLRHEHGPQAYKMALSMKKKDLREYYLRHQQGGQAGNMAPSPAAGLPYFAPPPRAARAHEATHANSPAVFDGYPPPTSNHLPTLPRAARAHEATRASSSAVSVGSTTSRVSSTSTMIANQEFILASGDHKEKHRLEWNTSARAAFGDMKAAFGDMKDAFLQYLAYNERQTNAMVASSDKDQILGLEPNPPGVLSTVNGGGQSPSVLFPNTLQGAGGVAFGRRFTPVIPQEDSKPSAVPAATSNPMTTFPPRYGHGSETNRTVDLLSHAAGPNGSIIYHDPNLYRPSAVPVATSNPMTTFPPTRYGHGIETSSTVDVMSRAAGPNGSIIYHDPNLYRPSAVPAATSNPMTTFPPTSRYGHGSETSSIVDVMSHAAGHHDPNLYR